MPQAKRKTEMGIKIDRGGSKTRSLGARGWFITRGVSLTVQQHLKGFCRE